MLTSQQLKQIQAISFTSRKRAQSLFSGIGPSFFHSHGMEFMEVREYSPGDDIRYIDWNVSARMDKPYIKLFTEEKEQTVLFLLDVSASMNFGSQGPSKKEFMFQTAALLSYAAIYSHNRVGLGLFSEKLLSYIPPFRGRHQVIKLLSKMMEAPFTEKGTHFDRVFKDLHSILSRRIICVIISDFLNFNEPKYFDLFAKRHEVIPLVISDPLEHRSFGNNFLFLEDMENSKQGVTSHRSLSPENSEDRTIKLREYFLQHQVRPLFLSNKQTDLKPLVNYFIEREKWI